MGIKPVNVLPEAAGNVVSSIIPVSVTKQINSTKFEEDKLRSLGTFETKSVIHRTIICDMNGVKARALIDTGAGNSYISTYLIKQLNSKPLRKEERLIEQMY